MTLSKWIKSRGGPSKLAKILGVTRQCVESWVSYKAMPRPHVMFDIVKRSKNKVSYAATLADFIKNSK